MPRFNILIGGSIQEQRTAETAGQALTEFLDVFEDQTGIKRTSPVNARFFDTDISVRLAEDQVAAGWAANLTAWDKKRGASVRSLA